MDQIKYLSPEAWKLLKKTVKAAEKAPDKPNFKLENNEFYAAKELHEKSLAYAFTIGLGSDNPDQFLELSQTGKDYFYLNTATARFSKRFWSIFYGVIGGAAVLLVERLLAWLG